MSEDVAENELRVPVAALPALVSLRDGGTIAGRIFLPANAPHHDGPTRPDEWINEPGGFFPFLLDGGDGPVLLNKAAVLAITLPAWAAEADPDIAVDAPLRGVVVECGGASFRGALVLDVPANRGRVLDLLNLPQAFITVREGDRHHLVNKRHITRVIEERSG